MIGGDESPQTLGAIPSAVAWLFKLINEKKERTSTRFSVRVSAVEVHGKQEHLRDLLVEQANGTFTFLFSLKLSDKFCLIRSL